MRFRSQNLNLDENGQVAGSKFWHGRAWLRLSEALHAHVAVEWTFGGYARFTHLGIECDLVFEKEITFMVALWGVFSLFFKFHSTKFPHWDLSHGNRTLEVAIHDGCLWIRLWGDDAGCGPRRLKVFCIVNFIFGSTRRDDMTLDKGVILIPMVERAYAATWEKWVRVEKRPRWPKKTKSTYYRFVFESEGGIPIPGKGESVWDIGDDAYLSIGVRAHSLYTAVSKVVETVLRTRYKYGGTSWLPGPDLERGNKHVRDSTH